MIIYVGYVMSVGRDAILRLSPFTCNDGSRVLSLANGDRVEDAYEDKGKYYDGISGNGVCCSICGHAVVDDAYWL